ncbi:hypothetical protein ACRALDRAFT_1083049 [Sodiomyces alcalophilus JCM 7366]|uniref:uncharacterized protein n=1 Tax=Sodiomyces alcalophilus JCM 7366 TaxID=591952 RepID=UPI0039B5BF14
MASPHNESPDDGQPPSAEHTYFFYGSLMDPTTFQGVTLAPNPPEYRDAWIEGYQVRMWGPYPALCPVSSAAGASPADAKPSRVVGKVWVDPSRDPYILHRLQRYETANYEPRIVTAHFFDGKSPPAQMRAFVWAGAESLLSDGEFDLKVYQGRSNEPPSP